VVLPAGDAAPIRLFLDAFLAGGVAIDQLKRREFAKPFAVSKFEVTFAEWDACADAGTYQRVADHWGRGQMPVINVSWGGATQYVRWLSRLTATTLFSPRARARRSTGHWTILRGNSSRNPASMPNGA
jgi:hypothetical protein